MKDTTDNDSVIWTASASSLEAGIWTLRLEGGHEAPRVEALHRHRRIIETKVEKASGAWIVTVTLPRETLTDGLESVHLLDRGTGTTLASLNIAAGRPVPAHMAEELALLRDELELLKRAFRRHLGS